MTVTLETPLPGDLMDALSRTRITLDENFCLPPGSLLGYDAGGNQVRIWATESIPADSFMERARYALSEIAKIPGLEKAAVTKVATKGVDASYSGTTLAEVGASISLATRPFKNPAQRPGCQP